MKKKEMKALLERFVAAVGNLTDDWEAAELYPLVEEFRAAYPPEPPPEWTPWEGGIQPVHGRVKVQYRRGTTSTTHDASAANWKHARQMPMPDEGNDIIAYKEVM